MSPPPPVFKHWTGCFCVAFQIHSLEYNKVFNKDFVEVWEVQQRHRKYKKVLNRSQRSEEYNNWTEKKHARGIQQQTK